MSDVLEMLRARNRHELTLKSGLRVAGHLPDLTECMLAGDVPLGVLQELQKTIEGTPTNGGVSAEDLRHVYSFNREVVKAFTDEIEGEPVEMTDDIVAALSPDDRAEIVAFATRATAPPGD
jgi:hypothetical protein